MLSQKFDVLAYNDNNNNNDNENRSHSINYSKAGAINQTLSQNDCTHQIDSTPKRDTNYQGDTDSQTLAHRLHNQVDTISKLYPEIKFITVSGKKPKCGDNWQQKEISLETIHDLIAGKVKFQTEYKDGKKVPGSEKLIKLTDYQRKAQFKCWFGDYVSNSVTGVGIRTGEVSGGIVSVDLDGWKAIELAESQGLPLTPSWTSGKPGRRGCLFRVPRELWESIKNTKGVPLGDGDAIEFLWNGSQFVAPPSLYVNGYKTASSWQKALEDVLDASGNPVLNESGNRQQKRTGDYQWTTQDNPGYIEGLVSYKWINNISTIPIAEAPQWVIAMMLKSATEETDKLNKSVAGKKTSEPRTPKNYDFDSVSDSDEWTKFLVRSAWQYIREVRSPLSNQYPRLCRKTFALVAGVGASEAYDLASSDWDDKVALQTIINSYNPHRGGGISVGTYFDFAKGTSWKRPAYNRENCELAGIAYDPDYLKKAGSSVVRLIKFLKEKKTQQLNPAAEFNPLNTQVEETRKSIWEKQVFSFDADQVFDDKFLEFEKIKAAIVATPNCWLVNTKSPTGSGKTEVLNALLDWLETTGKIKGCFFPTYRNTLALNLCTRVNHLYHLNFHDGLSMVGDTHGRLTCCVDSILKLPPGYGFGRAVVLDEINSVLHHLTMSSTLNGKRRAVAAKFAELIRDAAFVITLDGNLTNRDAAYIKTLRGVTDNSGVVNLLNETQPKDTPVTLIASFKQSVLVAKLDELLPVAMAAKKTIVVFADSQKLLEKLHEKYSKVLPANEIIRIDSKTTGDKNSGAKEYMENPSRLPILLLLSPSGETGLNIDNSNFEIPQGCAYGFGFTNGTISPGSVLQLCRRVRFIDNVFIQCNPYVMVQGDRYATAKEFKENQAIAVGLDALAHPDYARELINKDSTDPTYNLLADHMAEKSYSQVNTFECLVEMFQHHGYSPELVTDIELDNPESEDKAKSDLKDMARIIAVREAEGILNAEDINHDMAKRLKDSYDLSPEKRLQLERYIIKERLPDIDQDPAWWDVEGLIEIRKEWRQLEPLTINVYSKNLEKAQQINNQKWERWIEGDRFLGDCGRAVYAKSAFIASLNLDKLPEILSKDSPELKEFFKSAKAGKKKFKALLGMDLSKLDIETGDLIILFKKLIRSIGLKLESVERKNKQSRSYKLAPQKGVIDLFLRKIGQTLESQAEYALHQSTYNQNSITNILDVDCKKEQKKEQVLETAAAVFTPTPEPTHTPNLDLSNWELSPTPKNAVSFNPRQPPARIEDFPIVDLIQKVDGKATPVKYFITSLDWLGDLAVINENLTAFTTIAIGQSWIESGEYATPETAKVLRGIIQRSAAA